MWTPFYRPDCWVNSNRGGLKAHPLGVGFTASPLFFLLKDGFIIFFLGWEKILYVLFFKKRGRVENMTIAWQRKMNPRNVLLSGDGRGIIPQVRIWLLQREDLSERERGELVNEAVKAYRSLKKEGQAPWEAFGDGYDPPELGVTCYLKQWIEEGPNPEIPLIRPPIGQRYFLKNHHGNRNPAFTKTPGRVFLCKHNLHAPLSIGAVLEARNKFAAGVAAWQALTQTEKEIWKRHSYARAFHLPGYNTFLSFYMRGKI